MNNLLVLLSVVITGLSACASAQEKQHSTTAGDAAAPDEAGVEPPMNLAGQIDYARKDMAARLDVPLDAVAVSGARYVNWRSGALGCPEPDRMYTDALVPGAVIYLKAGGAIHAYHAAMDSPPFYCPRERAEQPLLDDSSDPT